MTDVNKDTQDPDEPARIKRAIHAAAGMADRLGSEAFERGDDDFAKTLHRVAISIRDLANAPVYDESTCCTCHRPKPVSAMCDDCHGFSTQVNVDAERMRIALLAETEADRLDAEARQARINLDFNLRDQRDIEGDAVRAFAAKLRAEVPR